MIEIRLTKEFAEQANRQIPAGLFVFEPFIKGKTEWTDETTLVFRPAKLLDPGKIYSGELNLYKLGEVKERLKVFPLRIQTLRKDFTITTGALECPSAEENKYILNGELVASDFIEEAEVEKDVGAKLGKKKMAITWDHSGGLENRNR